MFFGALKWKLAATQFEVVVYSGTPIPDWYFESCCNMVINTELYNAELLLRSLVMFNISISVFGNIMEETFKA